MAPIIQVSNLKKYYQSFEKEPGVLGSVKSIFVRKYKDIRAVDNISFSIKEGELVGFIGPNGAGKTTTLKVLSGLLYPTAGKVEVLGFTPWERKDNFLRNISLVMGQKNQLWWELPPMETFLLNRAIYGIPEKEFNETLEELTKLLGVKHLLSTPVRKLSLGERMKMELIAALIYRPKFLFLDEPTIGLDIVMQKVLRDFISDYNRRFGATILLTSHYMDDVEALASRVIIIDKGKLIFDGRLTDIIRRFAKKRVINLVFTKEPDFKKLSKIGEVVHYDFPKSTISVPRQSAPMAASEILQNFAVADLTIEDTPIEDIVRGVFEKGV